MHRASKLIALGAVAAVLAACSGGNGTTSLPSTPQSTGNRPTAQSFAPRSAMGSDGHVMTFFYNKQAELGGLVTNTPSDMRTAQASSGGNLTYHGGPVQTAPKIYVVHWGSATQWGSGDIHGVATYYQNFISGIGGSQWLSSVTQYTQSNGSHVGNAAGSYAGTWNDTTNAIPSLTRSSTYQNNIAAEAKRAAAHFGDYSTSASYVIMIPHGVQVYNFAGNSRSMYAYCAWHSSTSATGGTIAYTNLPYIPDAGASCGSNSVNSNGPNDGVSIVGGHEQGETETDPQPNTGWLDSSGSENGDKCAWTGLQNTSFSTGTFPTQPLWSNSANGCVQ